MAERQYKKSIATQQALVSAAQAAAKRMEDVSTLSIRDICKEAGLSVGAFYHHFSSKDDLLRHAFLKFDREVNEEVLAQLDGMPPLDAVKLLLLEMVKFAEGVEAALTREYFGATVKGEGQKAVDPARPYYEAVTRYVQSAADEGSLVLPCTAQDAAVYLIKCMRGCMLDWCLHDGGYDLITQTTSELEWYLGPFLAR